MSLNSFCCSELFGLSSSVGVRIETERYAEEPAGTVADVTWTGPSVGLGGCLLVCARWQFSGSSKSKHIISKGKWCSRTERWMILGETVAKEADGLLAR